MEEIIELSQSLTLMTKILDYQPEDNFILMKILMMLDQVFIFLAVKNMDKFLMDSIKFLTQVELKGSTWNLNKILERELIFKFIKKMKPQNGIQKDAFLSIKKH